MAAAAQSDQAAGRDSDVADYHEADEGCPNEWENDNLSQLLLVTAEKDAKRRYCCGRLSLRQFLALAVVLTAIVCSVMVVIGIYVIGPRIAQHELAEATVTFRSFNISEPCENGFRASALAEYSGVTGFSATVHEMVVEVLFNGTTFGTLTVPATEVEAGGVTSFEVDSFFNISNTKIWNDCGKVLALSPEVLWDIKGTATATVTSLGVSLTFDGIDFQKQVAMKGLDGLKQTKILNFEMNQSTEEEVRVTVEAAAFNPSFTRIENIGNLDFNMSFQESFMGTVVAANVSLEKGWTTLKMTGVFNPDSIPAADVLMTHFLLGQPANVTCTALGSSIAIFSDVFAGINLTTTLDQGPQVLITGMKVPGMELTPLNDTAVHLALNTTVGIRNPLGNHSAIDISEVSLSAQALDSHGALLGTVVTEKVPIENGNLSVININTNADMMISEAGWDSFVASLLNEPEVVMKLNGTASAITYVDALDKTLEISAPVGVAVTTPGMNGLRNITIINFTVSGNETTTTIGASTVIYNPSIATVHMGDMTVEFKTQGAKVGSLTARGLTIVPGNNSVTMTGVVDPAPGDLEVVGDFFSEYLSGSASLVGITGKEAGQEAPQWLQKAVQDINTTSSFPGYDSPDTLLGSISVQSMGMRLDTEGNPWMAAEVGALMQLPTSMDMKMDISCAAMDFDMVDADGVSVLASMTVPCEEAPVKYTPHPCGEYCGGILNISVSYVKMKVVSWEKLSAFLGQAMRKDSVTATLRGTSGPRVKTPFAPNGLNLHGIAFSSEVAIQGMGGFVNAVTVGSIDITGGRPGELDMVTTATLNNPSSVDASLGSITFDLNDGADMCMGKITVANFTLKANAANAMTATAVYSDPVSSEWPNPGHVFLSTYLTQQNQTVKLKNGKAAPPYDKLLQGALEGFEMESILPGRTGKLMEKGVMPWRFNLLKIMKNLPVKLTVNNPYSAAVAISGANETITYIADDGTPAHMGVYTYCDQGDEGCIEGHTTSTCHSAGTCTDNLILNPIELGPNMKSTQIEQHSVKMNSLTVAEIKAFMQLICPEFPIITKCKASSIPISIAGMMNMTVGGPGGFSAWLNVTESFICEFGPIID